MVPVDQLTPILIPLALVQLALMIIALVHVFRHHHYRFGSRTLWVIAIVCLGFLGPLAYLLFGQERGQTSNEEEDAQMTPDCAPHDSWSGQ
ncbi:hypothetical protein CRD59_04080 [Bifidobacterium xylocopae]|uniref:Cardiolipin synthase N-terminal domain-containing protein n=2 Tax=Bifidobacterium xylocopae TaxID=2493119 RepID=A0A366KCH5_9BIFI|nr:hypothetical protein CRD59_04080 [Bifidobacterium xylocopae]